MITGKASVRSVVVEWGWRGVERALALGRVLYMVWTIDCRPKSEM